MRDRTETDQLAVAAIVSAASMIAFQVSGKATRDALFLSNFPITTLPSMLVLSAGLSLIAVLAISRLVSRRGPTLIISLAFAASALLLLVQWAFLSIAPKAVTVALYLHMAAFGAILISGFWGIVAELFDPRTAKTKIGRIAAGGTLGGLIGGVIAERTGTLLSVTSILPVLAILHLGCAILSRSLHNSIGDRSGFIKSDPSSASARSGWRVLSEVPYVKHLAVLVLLGTLAEVLLDFLLKTHASAAFNQGQELLRFFALF